MGLSNAPVGFVGGFIVLPLPQILAADGVSPARIAAISGVCLLPGFWVLFLGPLLDLRFTRRYYATGFAALSALLLGCAVLMRHHMLVLEVLVTISYAGAMLSSNALGGWLSSIVPEDDQRGLFESRLSAWTQVGFFIGNGAMAALAPEALRTLPLLLAAALLGAMVFLPAAIFLWMPVPPHEAVNSRRLASSYREFLKVMWTLLKRRDTVLALLLFIAPTGAFALTNFLSGISHDFHTTDAFVSRMGGLVLTIAGAAACLLPPVLARWFRPLPLYLLIGSAGSVFTLLLLLLPRTPETFALAFLGENVFQAMSFTAVVAVCLTVIGRENPLAATQFGLLTAVTVLPIVYMGALDGRVYEAMHGIAGTLLVDGGLSLVSCVVMCVMMKRLWFRAQPTR